MPQDDPLERLREALAVSPDNVPLRRLLAESLLEAERPGEAEREFRTALALAPGEPGLELGLARAFVALGKGAEAAVLVEHLLAGPDPSPAAELLAARLCLEDGEPARAAEHYLSAVARDPGLADVGLARRLGLTVSERRAAGEEEAGGDLDEVGRSPELPPIDPWLAPQGPAVTFGDVGGMERAKEEIRLKIIHPLEHADLYALYGKAAGGGMLLYGPPGCGKTLLARATAGEIGRPLLSVGLDQILDMWLGASERNLHRVFEEARRRRPCALFFDEVDALGASRSHMRHSAGRHVINQFLTELDATSGANAGVLVLAATNAPWHLDPAFRRPGRFDRLVFVPPPDAAARAEIVRVLLRGRPAAEIDDGEIAARTAGFSGADLAAVVDVAIEGKLREAMRDGVPRPLGTKDLLNAARGLRPSTLEWLETARSHATFANQAGVYDDVLDYLEGR